MCGAHSRVKENDIALEALCMSRMSQRSCFFPSARHPSDCHLLSNSLGGTALTGTLKSSSFCPQNVCNSHTGGGIPQPGK